MADPALVWFNEDGCRDVACAGGKGASLAAMTALGLPVPPGFVLASWVLERSVDAEKLRRLAVAKDHAAAQALVAGCEPRREEIVAAYAELGEPLVAVRSSACAEDSEAASYAGQQETYLNVSGGEDVCRRVVECWASFFSERALFYRARKGSLEDLRMAVVVQQMVEPKKSGVLFTVDPVQRRRDQMIVEAIYGLGEQVVSGEATPDHYVLDRAGATKREHVPNGGVLDASELAELAALGRSLEEQFGGPQDVEWAIADGRLYLLQSRPVTTL
ncbi:MAG: pyruvate, water dikinase [Actinobacteria bacterium]|nr:MAG: pyruvate, water dikinase [Actinomycetota bacterium]